MKEIPGKIEEEKVPCFSAITNMIGFIGNVDKSIHREMPSTLLIFNSGLMYKKSIWLQYG